MDYFNKEKDTLIIKALYCAIEDTEEVSTFKDVSNENFIKYLNVYLKLADVNLDNRLFIKIMPKISTFNLIPSKFTEPFVALKLYVAFNGVLELCRELKKELTYACERFEIDITEGN